MHNTQKYEKIMEIYRKDERVRNFILEFFKTRKGVRCISFQDKLRSAYWRYGWNEQKALTGLNIENFWNRIGDAKGLTSFFYGYIFDDVVTNPNVYHWEYVKDDNGDILVDNHGKKKIKILHDYDIIGDSIVFEIDAPKAKKGHYNIGGKVDIFDKNYYSLFMWVKTKVEQELDRLGIKYNCLFSGNGIYIIIQSIYFEEHNIDLEKMRNIKQNMFEKVQPFVVNKKSSVPAIDIRDIGWALYFKSPFTFHEIADRMVIPVSKGYINREWLDNATDINSKYVISSDNITDILKRCKWDVEIW